MSLLQSRNGMYEGTTTLTLKTKLQGTENQLLLESSKPFILYTNGKILTKSQRITSFFTLLYIIIQIQNLVFALKVSL